MLETLNARVGNRSVAAMLTRSPQRSLARWRTFEVSEGAVVSLDEILRHLRGVEDVLNDRVREIAPHAEAWTGRSLRTKPVVSTAARPRVAKPRVQVVNEALREVAAGGGPHAAEAQTMLDEIEGLQQEARELNARVRSLRAHGPGLARPPAPGSGGGGPHGGGGGGGAGGGGSGSSGSASGGSGGATREAQTAAMEADQSAAKTAVKEGESVAVKEGESVAVKEIEKVAVKEGEKVAAKGGRLYARIAAKIGIELLDALIPDPLDALELMVDFAGSYTAAKEAIRERNLQNGFATGWAAYLVIPRWEWAKWFAYTTVSRDVAAEIVGAVGVAENAFNEGLVRGFIYGEKHTAAQSDRLRQKAFDAVLKTTGHTPGRYDGDDVYTFGRDDVYSFAGALRSAAVEVLKEADQRRAARLERERLAKHAKAVEKRFGTGASWPR